MRKFRTLDEFAEQWCGRLYLMRVIRKPGQFDY
jgi:hypothetical protein